MTIAIDVILLLSAVIVILLSFYRGFIRSFFGWFKSLMAFGIAYFFAPYAGVWLCDHSFYPAIYQTVYNSIDNLASNGSGIMDAQSVVAELPPFLSELLRALGITQEQLESQFAGRLLDEQTMQELSIEVAYPIAKFASNAVCYVGIFILSLLVLSLLAFVLDKVFRVPVLFQINRGLGLLFGVFAAVLNMLILSSIITIVLYFAGAASPELSAEVLCEKTYIYRFFYRTDLIERLMHMLTGSSGLQ